MRTAAAIAAVCVGAVWAGAASAETSVTRSSSFTYSAAGLLNQEKVEPGTPALTLTTDYTFDAFGNKTGATVSGNGFAPRTATITYDTRGQFATSNTNALGHSESWQFDARFAKPTSQTGPNGLTTTWTYDSFGRKTLEVRADGTRTAFAYKFCSGVNGGTATCVSGAKYLVEAKPLAADGTTQNGPLGTVYFDALNREIARDTQGFDGSTVRALREYDAAGRVLRTSRPYFTATGTPQWTTFAYDALDRVIQTTQPDTSVSTQAYHGLVTSETNALSQTRSITKNPRGEVIAVTDALNNTMTHVYDPVGNLLSTTDAAGNVTSATYDLRGRKIGTSDPNLGLWTYNYNAIGEVTSQVDAKSQVTTFAYDKLSRPLQRVEADMTSEWVYGTVAPAIGKLTTASITAGTGAGHQRSYTYDSLGRPTAVATTIDATVYTATASYDANSRLSTVTYPSGFVARYSYNALGYSNQLKNDATSQVYWTVNAIDAEQHITSQTLGNSLVTTRTFSALTGRVSNITTAGGSTLQNVSYTYDLLGNPLTRSDAVTNLGETFTYDALNRLTSATVSTEMAPAKSYSYNAVGNILSKSDVGDYSYAPPGSPRPHAVVSISPNTSGGTISTTFTYDANGNQTSGLGRTVAWTSYNKPATITSGTQAISFQDDVNHQRFKQVTTVGSTSYTTLYFDAFGMHAELVIGATTSRWSDFLSAGNQLIGVRYLDVGPATVTTRYFHTDHLGSVSLITSDAGAVVQRLSYDAWGKRRETNGTDVPTGTIVSETTRGFTGEEELSVGGLVHLNGRVYDPMLARMVSADPIVPDALNPQAWNRYSYVGNDPLAFTDPSGHSWLSSFFRSVGSFVRSIMQIPIVRAIVQVALTVALYNLGPLGAAIAAAAVTGMAGGKLGDVLKAAVIAYATASAFDAVGTWTTGSPHGLPVPGTPMYAANVAGHAAVGCISAVASGGKCGPGALSAGVGAAATPYLASAFPNARTDTGDLIGGTAAHAVLGGVASVAGGGKFENGAVTAAFGYLFNQTLGERRANHEAAVAAEMAKYQAAGFTTTPNVAFIVDGVRVVVDFIVSSPGPFFNLQPNPQFGVDVKTGSADLTENQKLVYPKLIAGTEATPVGLRALQAGFIPGVKTWIQMHVAIPRYPALP